MALQRLALAAKNAGHTVKIISLKPLGVVGKQLKQGGIDAVSLDVRGKFNPVQFAGALARLIEEIQAFSPDVVHAFLYRAIQLCRLAKKRVSFHLITTPHYDVSKRNFLLRLWDRSLKNADDISCAESQSTLNYLKKKQKYSDEKLQLITNGVDTDFFAPNARVREEVRSELGFSSEDTIFCCVARLSKEKNHTTLLNAFAAVHIKHPQTRLLLVGDGPEKENLQALSREENIEKAVIWAGDVSDVKNYLLASDVFVLVSLEESLPLSLLEACSCGLPSIVSKVGDMPRVVQHGETGFVCNGRDPIIISALMAQFLAVPQIQKQMGLAAREHIKTQYGAKEEIYLKIYTKFC